ncbi:MAG: precorrin-2 dehydrogenase/sirohydrochlorin ferrochelatase family protein [Thermodesulfobacteriota bacterium]|jgi:precorrin-2 dehydrogenase/sirohydrochlorin ferrochelatase
MKQYPVNLDVERRKCVVVGGGKVAEKKVLGLLECGADVSVISPQLVANLKELSDKRVIKYLKRAYKPGDLKGAYLVVASTNSHKVNRRVGEEARRLGILVNVVSAPSLSDFSVPAVLRRGEFMLTVSTSGKSPALSRRLRMELEDAFGDEYDAFTEILGRIRKRFRDISPENRKRIYTQVAMSSIPLLLREKRLKEAERELKRITGLDFNEIKLPLK